MAIIRGLITVFLLVLSFVRIYIDKAHIPNVNQEGQQTIEYVKKNLSMAEKLAGSGLSVVLVLIFAVFLASIVLSVMTFLMKDNKQIETIGKIVFLAAILAFIAGIVLAGLMNGRY